MILGIDVGQNGGLSLLDKHRNIIIKRVMPINHEKELDTKSLINLIKNNDVKAVFIEKVHAMPNQGVVSMFTFGKHFGEILGTIKTLGIPYHLVRPREWQAYAHKDVDKRLKPKEKSLLAVKKFYPDIDFRKSERAKVDHDGIVDATLIALYGLQEYVIQET